MSAERISLAPCLPWSSRSEDAPATGIVARRCSLEPDQVGRIALFSNTRQAREASRPLLLLHGMHVGAGAHDMRLLFDALRAERPVHAPDLPGFGSSERGARDYTPELYVRAIEALIEHTASPTQGIDVVAAGLTCEYAAQAAVHLPELVRSLTLLSPTGFAVKREQQRWERASRRGRSAWPVPLLTKLGVAPLLYRVLVSGPVLEHGLRRAAGAVDAQQLRARRAAGSRPGAEHAALALLEGKLFPPGNPQSVYTRVHCPTLILRGGERDVGFGSLECFVKWHEYFTAEEVSDTSLLHAASAQEVEQKLREFWASVLEQERADAWPAAHHAAASSY